MDNKSASDEKLISLAPEETSDFTFRLLANESEGEQMDKLMASIAEIDKRYDALIASAVDEHRKMIDVSIPSRGTHQLFKARNALLDKRRDIRKRRVAELEPFLKEKRRLERQAYSRHIATLEEKDFRELVVQAMTDFRFPEKQ